MSDPGGDLSKEEALALQKIRIRRDMEEEITEWAKKRFTMLALVIAVLGFFGLSTVLHQSLQFLVTRPVERELSKIDVAREEARRVVANLTDLSFEVEEKGRNAEAAATKAAEKVQELERSIAEGNRKVREIKEAFETLQAGIGSLSGNIFDLASVSSGKELRLRADIHKASRALDALQSLASTIAESFKTTKVEAALKQFHSDIRIINADYVSEYTRINKMETFNIVFYVDRQEDSDVARAAVDALKRSGYRAALWYAEGKTRAAVIAEISKEFGDISDILETNYQGMIVHPEHDDVADEVKQLLVSTRELSSLVSVRRPLHPSPVHLQRGEDKVPFDSDRVILIYSLNHPRT